MSKEPFGTHYVIKSYQGYLKGRGSNYTFQSVNSPLKGVRIFMSLGSATNCIRNIRKIRPDLQNETLWIIPVKIIPWTPPTVAELVKEALKGE